jgi:glycosyltransferase involved in cell wall biosynthesis
VAHHNLQNDVSFIGAVPHSKLPQLISASDIVAIPSLMEASSLLLIESMACKRPVVATNVGGIPEIMTEGCGVLVSPRDTLALSQAVNQLIADQGLREKLASKAYLRVIGSLTWDKIAQQTENAYATAVA